MRMKKNVVLEYIEKLPSMAFLGRTFYEWNTARNKQIVFFADSRKTVKLKLILEKAKIGHSGEFLDINQCYKNTPWAKLESKKTK